MIPSTRDQRRALLGKKVGMTHLFSDAGDRVPVTVLEVGPCTVLQVKTEATDGYVGYQLGFQTTRKKVKKPQERFFEKVQIAPKQFVREVPYIDPADVAKTRERKGGEQGAADRESEEEPADAPAEVRVGDEISVLVFENVKHVDISGTSKGRGYSGTVRRWGFHCGPKSHGSKNIREPGSIGMHTDPGRVLKGTKLAGQYGAAKRTAKRIEIVGIEADENLLLVRGSVPGPRGGFIVIRESQAG